MLVKREENLRQTYGMYSRRLFFDSVATFSVLDAHFKAHPWEKMAFDSEANLGLSSKREAGTGTASLVDSSMGD